MKGKSLYYWPKGGGGNLNDGMEGLRGGGSTGSSLFVGDRKISDPDDE
ncbi:MAG: hypothetical protein HYT12_02935 [Candidatus Liptonbacteria bacterium]|nr:hypothetical protein [Candidatus Liptonbacteria bacterium]